MSCAKNTSSASSASGVVRGRPLHRAPHTSSTTQRPPPPRVCAVSREREHSALWTQPSRAGARQRPEHGRKRGSKLSSDSDRSTGTRRPPHVPLSLVAPRAGLLGLLHGGIDLLRLGGRGDHDATSLALGSDASLQGNAGLHDEGGLHIVGMSDVFGGWFVFDCGEPTEKVGTGLRNFIQPSVGARKSESPRIVDRRPFSRASVSFILRSFFVRSSLCLLQVCCPVRAHARACPPRPQERRERTGRPCLGSLCQDRGQLDAARRGTGRRGTGRRGEACGGARPCLRFHPPYPLYLQWRCGTFPRAWSSRCSSST